MSLKEFRVARYHFVFEVTRPMRLPDYAGSMLRGAFGHALRQIACMTKQKECEGCPLLCSCSYPKIFAPPPPETHTLQKFTQIPVPYVIEPPAWGARVLDTGEAIDFHMVLVGRAIDELPLIVLAWRRAFARGVGAGDGTAEIVRVLHCRLDTDLEIYTPASGTIAPHETTVPCTPWSHANSGSVTLEFTTPLRLQHNGRALRPDQLIARTLLMALLRRASLLSEFHDEGPLLTDFAPLSETASKITDQKHLAWRDWTRYSSRQHQSMALGGAIGRWTLNGDLTPFAPYLQLGEFLHVGKEAAFGLGGYSVLR